MKYNGFDRMFEKLPFEVSAPCRVDFGGTLDLPAMHYPLRHISPCTFNIALDMRTSVRISAYKKGFVKISSRGFSDAEFPSDSLPFRHEMGLMFAVSAYFNLDGVHMEINSESPPRSALGGSSVAAVALVGGLMYLLSDNKNAEIMKNDDFRTKVCLTAHAIESGTAGVPCGYQDQLAAAFGGANLWSWTADPEIAAYTRDIIYPENITLSENASLEKASLKDNILVAYCGRPHVSADINGEWMRRFAEGERLPWIKISDLAGRFSGAFSEKNWNKAADLMIQETETRLLMTPDVLDETGKKLYESAKQNGCGARFAGAGGGGCVWAIGEKENIAVLRNQWMDILDSSDGGRLLDTDIDLNGLMAGA